MEEYDFYKDSGVEWIGEIPEHWEVRKLGSQFSDIGSGTTPEAGSPRYYENGTTPWLNTGDLNDDILNSCQKSVTELAMQDHSVLKVYPKGTLVMAMYGATIGKLCILNFYACTNQACCAINNSHTLSIKYTFYWLLGFRDEIIRRAYGGGQPNISQDVIRRLKIAIPNHSEQKAIVLYLDDHTQKLDKLIKNKKKQIARLKELRQIEINKAVTKGLNPDVLLKDSGVEWLGKIPEHWEVKRGKNILGLVSERATGDRNKIALENIISGLGKLVESDSVFEGEGIAFEKDDILYGKLRPYLAKVHKAEESGAAVGDFYVFRCKYKIYPGYAFYTLLNQAFTDIASNSTYGAKMPRVSWDFIANLSFSVPNSEEQKAVALYLDKYTSAIDQTITNLEAQISQLQEVRKIEIFSAVTGKVKVPARYFEQQEAGVVV
ncbi:restriction endonuclease subunit S [Pontibacter sp. JH31]|uniref:Restriction endonuclease subunit S n=1 Tax=Pontibacter aquaedesilientis TaxID=2766980 RepID=A0ABR7XFH0_9BACT|nr:restriction endonuclease subunit S [Pontibacter aquaedesilientis]MBD1397040.1 restriction endonuclease subunit S [Pontibacter aquaedesilientis]